MEAHKKKDGRARKPLPSRRGEQPDRGSSGPKAGKEPAVSQPDENDEFSLSPITLSADKLAANKRGKLHLGVPRAERMPAASVRQTPAPIDLTQDSHKQPPQNQPKQNQALQNQPKQNQLLQNQLPQNQLPQNRVPQNQHLQNRVPQNQHLQNQLLHNRIPQNQLPQNQPLQNRALQNQYPQNQHPQNQLHANQHLANQSSQNQDPQNSRDVEIEAEIASHTLGNARQVMSTINELGQVVMLGAYRRAVVERDLYAATAQRIESENMRIREKEQHDLDHLELIEYKYQNKALESQIASEKEQKNELRAELQGLRATQLTEVAEKARLQAENANLQAGLNDARAKVAETEKKLAFHSESSKKRHSETLHPIEKSVEASADSQSKTPPRKRARVDSAAADVPVTHVWDNHLARLNSNMRKFDVVRDPNDEKSPTYQDIFAEIAAILGTKRCTPKFESFLEYSRPGETYCLLQVLHDIEVGEQANPLTGESCNGHEHMGECLKVQCHKADGDEEKKKKYTFLSFDSNQLASN
ncbi:Ribosome-binding protein 1 [Colletotrichum shisoi]|uniref:Ribosome-binding protein 1 n=1 Tax=Colletotrichum shisoi TaxID=2078593 RepID=A0A5Q4BMI9_9PEZI|nr:Ribosome-binding protein 1 [Colletotrichum shisoi]